MSLGIRWFREESWSTQPSRILKYLAYVLWGAAVGTAGDIPVCRSTSVRWISNRMFEGSNPTGTNTRNL